MQQQQFSMLSSNIKEQVFQMSALQDASEEVKDCINALLDDIISQVMSPQCNKKIEHIEIKEQLDILLKTLNSPAKLSVLKDFNHRALIISFLKQGGMIHYKYSYYNRAKLTKNVVSLLDNVGPILFSEAVMIASKTNIINKSNSRIFIEDHLYTNNESPVDLKIQQILKLCDEKKRNVNNNFKKLELILEDPNSLEVIRELGKMLRDSWKKDKSRNKCIDVVKDSWKYNEAEQYEQEDYEYEEVNSKAGGKCESEIFSFTSTQKELMGDKRMEMAKGEFNLKIFDEDEFSQRSGLFDKSEQGFIFI